MDKFEAKTFAQEVLDEAEKRGDHFFKIFTNKPGTWWKALLFTVVMFGLGFVMGAGTLNP